MQKRKLREVEWGIGVQSIREQRWGQVDSRSVPRGALRCIVSHRHTPSTRRTHPCLSSFPTVLTSVRPHLDRAYRHPVSWHEVDRNFFCRPQVKEMFGSKKIRMRDHHAILAHVKQFDIDVFEGNIFDEKAAATTEGPE